MAEVHVCAQERHEPHLGLEGKPNGGQAVPGLAPFRVEGELRVVGHVAAHIRQVGQTTRSPKERRVLSLMHMHGRPGKVAQPAAVVKVHVGEHDMTDVFRLVPPTADLAAGRLAGVHGDR
jgi:hypothetical protein